jgi:hypothetical protein
VPKTIPLLLHFCCTLRGGYFPNLAWSHLKFDAPCYRPCKIAGIDAFSFRSVGRIRWAFSSFAEGFLFINYRHIVFTFLWGVFIKISQGALLYMVNPANLGYG